MTCSRTPARTHTRTHTHTHIYAQTHIHAQTHTHTHESVFMFHFLRVGRSARARSIRIHRERVYLLRCLRRPAKPQCYFQPYCGYRINPSYERRSAHDTHTHTHTHTHDTDTLPDKHTRRALLSLVQWRKIHSPFFWEEEFH